MSKATSSEKLQELLSATYADITQYALEEALPMAEKAFYSTRDYALGDTVLCSADAALENCEQIKGCFPSSAPRSVWKNIENVEAEIHRLEDKGRPFLAGKLWFLIVIAAVAFFVYFILTHRN